MKKIMLCHILKYHWTIYQMKYSRIMTEIVSDWCDHINGFTKHLCIINIKNHTVSLHKAADLWCGVFMLCCFAPSRRQHDFLELLSKCITVIGTAVSQLCDLLRAKYLITTPSIVLFLFNQPFCTLCYCTYLGLNSRCTRRRPHSLCTQDLCLCACMIKIGPS